MTVFCLLVLAAGRFQRLAAPDVVAAHAALAAASAAARQTRAGDLSYLLIWIARDEIRVGMRESARADLSAALNTLTASESFRTDQFRAAAAMAELGEVSEAIRLLPPRLSDRVHHLEYMLIVIRACSKAGRREDAGRLFAGLTESLVKEPINPGGKADELADLGFAMLQTGFTREGEAALAAAEGAASEEPDIPEYAAAAPLALSARLSSAGRLGDAARMAVVARQRAETISSPQWRARGLIDVAEALAAAGDSAAARSALRDAFALARTLSRQPNSHSQLALCGRLAERLTQADCLPEALAAARLCSEPAEQANALASVAGVLREHGRREEAARLLMEAMRVCRRSTDWYNSAWSLGALGTNLADCEKRREGRALIRQGVTRAHRELRPTERVELFVSLAWALNHAGDTSSARAVLMEALGFAERKRPGWFHYHPKGPTRADGLPHQIGWVSHANAVSEIAQIWKMQLECGDFDGAKRTVRKVLDNASIDWELIEFAQAHAKHHQPRAAMAAARSIDHPYLRAMAYIRIAETAGSLPIL